MGCGSPFRRAPTECWSLRHGSVHAQREGRCRAPWKCPCGRRVRGPGHGRHGVAGSARPYARSTARWGCVRPRAGRRGSFLRSPQQKRTAQPTTAAGHPAASPARRPAGSPQRRPPASRQQPDSPPGKTATHSFTGRGSAPPPKRHAPPDSSHRTTSRGTPHTTRSPHHQTSHRRDQKGTTHPPEGTRHPRPEGRTGIAPTGIHCRCSPCVAEVQEVSLVAVCAVPSSRWSGRRAARAGRGVGPLVAPRFPAWRGARSVRRGVPFGRELASGRSRRGSLRRSPHRAGGHLIGGAPWASTSWCLRRGRRAPRVPQEVLLARRAQRVRVRCVACTRGVVVVLPAAWVMNIRRCLRWWARRHDGGKLHHGWMNTQMNSLSAARGGARGSDHGSVGG